MHHSGGHYENPDISGHAPAFIVDLKPSKRGQGFAIWQRMARKKFVCETTIPYHVSSRCINKEWFDCPMQDVWQIFCTHLLYVQNVYNLRIHSFVLMSNHFHMLVTASEGNLSHAMCFLKREVSRDITHYSNRINGTFAQRFTRTEIDSVHYYLNAYKYVYLNPVTAKIVERVEDYKYSSLQFLIGKQPLLFTVDDLTLMNKVEETLRWLNSKPLQQDLTSIRTALKHSTFKLVPTNDRKPNRLESLLL